MDKDIADELLPTEGEGREEMKRLYAWREKDALDADDHGESYPRQSAWSRWQGAQALKELYEGYQVKKKPKAILEAIYLCAFYSLPIPRWCQTAYKDAYRKVREYEFRSWDEVFGKPHRKGTNLDAQKQWREKGHLIYRRIQRIKREDPSVALDNKLFECVGKELGRSRSLTQEYYYKWKDYEDSMRAAWEKENMT